MNEESIARTSWQETEVWRMKTRKQYMGMPGHEIDFVIPGFERSYPKGISSVYHLVIDH